MDLKPPPGGAATGRRAVGLRYRPADRELPRLVFKGCGPRAEQAIEEVMRAGRARLVRDPALVEQLFQLPVEAHISTDLYQAVATVIAHLLIADKQWLSGERTHV